jgi:modulator of FtsH protease HflK
MDNVIILGKSAGDWQRQAAKILKSGTIVLAVLILLFLAIAGRPYFTVGTTENGLVLRFGKHVRTVPPGLHWKLPWPIESVIKPDVQKIRRITIGFRSSDQTIPTRNQGPGQEAKTPVHDESLMLTGDLNILMVELAVQYRIKDPAAYVFNVREPGGDSAESTTLRDICESTLRRVIGDYGVDAPLTEGKAAIEDEIQEKAQQLADQYGLGLLLTSVNLQDVQPPVEVQPSFKSVVTAKENKQKYINEALGYQNGQMPRAEGKAAGVINQASGYARERVLKAQGEVLKFSALLTEYRKAQEVTRSRLYLEAMEEVLGKVGVTVIDNNLKGVLPFLDLSEKGLGPRSSNMEPEPDLTEPAQGTDSNFSSYEQGGEKP